MTKKMIEERIYYDWINLLNGFTLEEAVDKLIKIDTYGLQDVRLQTKIYGYELEIETILVGFREETNAEYFNRLNQEAEDEANKEEYERKEFERLKKKFGATK